MSALTSRIWAFKQTVRAIVHQKGLFLMALALASLAMTIPYFLTTLVVSLSGQVFDVPTQTEITVFAERSASSGTVRALADEIAKNGIINSVRIMDKKEALAMVNDSLGLKTERNDAANPLPDIIIATVAANVTGKELEQAVSELRNMRAVDAVAYDDQWARYLGALNRALAMTLVMVGSAVGLLVILVIFASVRLTTGAQRDEIRALYLFGATPAFIKRPYLWRGALTLALAAGISLGLTQLGLNLLQKPVADFLSLYGVQVNLVMPSYDWNLLYVAACAFVGWLVSSFAASDAVARAQLQPGS